tara:strand:- start:7193 stop:8008 length:816 start_codon:yes stop_codon:yes gene_type:complete
MNPLKSTGWLSENIRKVKVLDATWHMPNLNRNAFKEYQENHIEDSIFFDLDKNSNQKISLPHMLPELQEWEKIISKLGIKNNDHIIIYDNSDVLSASRCWFAFLYFGHDMKLVSVLDGGLKKWKLENRILSKEKVISVETNYKASVQKNLVINLDQVKKNIKKKEFCLVDARGEKRFKGLVEEPRKNLKKGNIKGSKNLPFTKIINSENNTFKKKEELEKIFLNNDINLNEKLAFSCGSGITACVLGLASTIINNKLPVIYDGSWAEYGLE